MRTHTYWTTGEIEDLKYLKTVEKLSNKEVERNNKEESGNGSIYGFNC